MTDAPVPRCSSGTAGALSAQLIEAAQRPACDTYSATLLLHASQMIDRLISPTPQIAGGVRETGEARANATAVADAIKAYFEDGPPADGRHSDAAHGNAYELLQWAEEELRFVTGVIAALSPQAQAGETKSAPVQPPSHSSGKRLPSGDAAGSGAGTFGVAQGAVICGEPVAWLGEYDGGVSVTMNRDTMAQWKDTLGRRITPLYASPPAALPAEKGRAVSSTDRGGK